MLISYPTRGVLLLGWCRLVARRYAVGRGRFQFPAFRAKFDLRVIWLSEVRVGAFPGGDATGGRQAKCGRQAVTVCHQTTSPRRQPVEQCNDGASVVPARHDGWSRVMSLQNAMARGWS